VPQHAPMPAAGVRASLLDDLRLSLDIVMNNAG
jgi:hypothetical protein